MQDLYHHIVTSLRSLLSRILEPKLDLDEFLTYVARAAKELSPRELEARVYEVDFIENQLTLRTSTQVDVLTLPEKDKIFQILPQTITGDATIENRVIMATRKEGYARSRFVDGQEIRVAFPIEFQEFDNPEGRTKYVLVLDKKGPGEIAPEILAALKDFSVLAGLAISIKELRDALSQYYEENRNLVLTGRHSTAIAHDIRSLNVGVGGYLAMVLRRLKNPSDEDRYASAQNFISLALDSSSQIEALLKEFSQFNKTSIDLIRDTDISEALMSKIDSLSTRLDIGRFVKFRVELPDDPVNYFVDRDWFGTVVENLVRNSVEACNGKTKITILLKHDSEKVSLTFQDNCGGIPPKLLSQVFTPFRSSKRAGQGLGLANAKKVVTDHGGTIQVENREGKGACFTMEFPKAAQEASGQEPESRD